MRKPTPAPPPVLENDNIKKWVKVLYLFYKYFDESPLSVSELWKKEEDIQKIGFNSIRRLYEAVEKLRNWKCVHYKLDGGEYGPIKHMLSHYGAHALHRRGLITDEEYNWIVSNIPLKLEAWGYTAPARGTAKWKDIAEREKRRRKR